MRVILNPAPAAPLDAALLRLVDVITPNETEAEKLTGPCAARVCLLLLLLLLTPALRAAGVAGGGFWLQASPLLAQRLQPLLQTRYCAWVCARPF